MVVKGQCLTCELCITQDDGYERQLRCMSTKRGRMLSYQMHTGKLSGGMAAPNGYVIGGTFIPNPVSKLDKWLRESMENRIPPKWCPKRQS